MKKKSMSIGTLSMLIGFALCIIKASGLGLVTWPWWVVTAPVWGPFAIFAIFMLFVYMLVGTRISVDAAAEITFDADGKPNNQGK